MDELEISGKRYVSTRRAAREHGYHSDYMGQLIRGKKVTGQKVGRAWYIEEGSLNAYLGKTTAEMPASASASAPVAEAPVPAPIVETPAPVPVVERLVAEEPVPAALEPISAATPKPVQEPVVEIKKEEAIHHVPHIEESETRIPVHAMLEPRGTSGLRYAADDSPVMPVVTRMPQPTMSAQRAHVQPALRAERTFPYVSLSVVAAATLAAALFASNFVTATVVSEEGKAASVQYAIHW